jgi:flavin reductase (DIM6/NTAB) family NADH-FMN oxidoreductase RutF
MDETRFRSALGRFATGVCVITTRDAAGPIGFTATSLASVSLEPPLVLFCLGREASVLPAFERAERFGVSVLKTGQEAVSIRFAADPRAGFDEWRWDAAASGAPLLSGRLAGLSCTVESVSDGGDHRIFIGRVVDADWCEDAEPLIHFRGRYRTLET